MIYHWSAWNLEICSQMRRIIDAVANRHLETCTPFMLSDLKTHNAIATWHLETCTPFMLSDLKTHNAIATSQKNLFHLSSCILKQNFLVPAKFAMFRVPTPFANVDSIWDMSSYATPYLMNLEWRCVSLQQWGLLARYFFIATDFPP